MAIRVSRQFVEAMVVEDPQIRIPAQYVMVLQGPESASEQSVTSAMTLTDVAVGSIPVLSESANNAMTLTDVAVGYNTTVAASANSAMTLNQVESHTGIMSAFATNTINLVSTATAVRDLPRAASNNITLTSLGGRVTTGAPASTLFITGLAAYFNLVADRTPAGNVMNLTQTVTSLSSLEASNDLGLVQSLEIQFPIKPVISHSLGLSQHTSTPHRAWVASTISMRGFLKTPLPPQNVTDTMNMVQNSPIGRFETTMNLTQSLVYGFSITAANTMNLTDTVGMIAIWNREVEHSDVVGHALTWYEDTPCGRKQYSPFQGENTITSDVGALREDLQDPQGDTGNFSLYTPYLGVPTSEVVLRKPELDNRDRNAFTRISQETRGGKLVVYSDPTWPKVRTLAVTIVGLTETRVDGLQAFMLATVGQEIGLTDWEGRLWKGFIANPNEPAVQDGRDMWTISFEFQGEALDVEQPGNDEGSGMVMSISQSVTAVIV